MLAFAEALSANAISRPCGESKSMSVRFTAIIRLPSDSIISISSIGTAENGDDFKKLPLVETWCKMYGIKYSGEKPEIRFNKLQTNIDFTSIFSSSIDGKIVRINLSGSTFNIKPDTSIIENSVKRIITGSGSFKNYELTVEWKENHIHTNGRIDTANFKGTLKR
jgi:hypothetical protein